MTPRTKFVKHAQFIEYWSSDTFYPTLWWIVSVRRRNGFPVSLWNSESGPKECESAAQMSRGWARNCEQGTAAAGNSAGVFFCNPWIFYNVAFLITFSPWYFIDFSVCLLRFLLFVSLFVLLLISLFIYVLLFCYILCVFLYFCLHFFLCCFISLCIYHVIFLLHIPSLLCYSEFGLYYSPEMEFGPCEICKLLLHKIKYKPFLVLTVEAKIPAKH